MALKYETDHGPGPKAALGLIVLKSDETIEAEFRSIFDLDGVALYHTRIDSAPEVTPETLITMKAGLADAAALLPESRPMDVIAYACTSGATVIGSDEVEKTIRKAHPTARTTNPALAVVAACRRLNISRIALISPYVAEVSSAICSLLQKNGISPVTIGSFEQSEESVVARISEQSVQEAVREIGRDPDIEAVFASCTNLRTFSVIDACEQQLGKPVISSNSALAWHMMTLAGLSSNKTGPGRLFD